MPLANDELHLYTTPRQSILTSQLNRTHHRKGDSDEHLRKHQ